MMINVAVSGACGRMGRMLMKKVLEQDDMELAGALEAKEHPAVGGKVSEITGLKGCELTFVSGIEDIARGWEVLVEFSSPEGTMSHLPYIVRTGRKVVIGTTGLAPGQLSEIEKCGGKIPVLFSPNMSVGVNLLFKLAPEIAGVLKDFDIEIVEMHHRRKKDAPSGTAARIAELIGETLGLNPEDSVHGRSGLSGRKPGEIGIHSVRGGTVTGEHRVIFAGDGERLELTHTAESRDIFVCGAMKAIRFIAKAGPGLYTMQDVIGQAAEEAC